MAKILYIEDIDDNIDLAETIVHSQGHELVPAYTAQAGLELALSLQPDLILLDLGLPDSDGQTLSLWLKDEPSLQGTPILVLTAWPEEVAQQTVEAYGLDGFLCKPYSVRQLIDAIDTLLGKRAA